MSDPDRVVESARNGRPATIHWPPRIVDMATALAEPDHGTPWRVDRLAADGHSTVLAAPSNVGKTWLALMLSHGVHHGEAVAGIACQQGRALYLDAENGVRLLARRFRAARFEADAMTSSTPTACPCRTT